MSEKIELQQSGTAINALTFLFVMFYDFNEGIDLYDAILTALTF